MNFEEYSARFAAHGRLPGVTVRPFADVLEGGRRYPLLRAETAGQRRLIITAGFHGDETAGPLTLVEYFEEIVSYAQSRGVGLTVYPSLNPSGFEDGTRYNRGGESPNNDLMRYEVTPGIWVGELEAGQTFIRHALFTEGPRETRALAAEIAKQPTPHAALDLHQDPYIKEPLSYAYTFGDSAPFRPMVAKMDKLVPVTRSAQVDDDVFTDADGLIRLHDGSVTDYFHREGVPYTAALETTTGAEMRACHGVNLIWIRGFIDLAAQR
jgi:hypothetical protein